MDTWVVVVITGEDEGMKIKRGSKDRALGDTSTLWVDRGRRALQKKCDTEKKKKPVSWASCCHWYHSPEQVAQIDGGRSLNRMALRVTKRLNPRRERSKSETWDYKMICLKWERCVHTFRCWRRNIKLWKRNESKYWNGADFSKLFTNGLFM